MKKLESSLTNMVLVLTLVAVIMGGVLAYVNHLTEGPIEQVNKQKTDDGIKAVMACDDVTVAQTDTFKVKDEKGKDLEYIVYQVNDAAGKELGAAVVSTSLGFGGDLKVMVGFDNEGNILGYTLLAHTETPGLGAKADKWFQADGKGSIIGKNPGEKSKGLGVTKDKDAEQLQVEAITASTITSRAFLKAINNAYGIYKDNCKAAPETDAATGATKKETNDDEEKKEDNV